MKKIACVFAGLLLVACLAASMTTQEIDTFLRNHTEEGYRFIKSSGDNTWYVAFKLPAWKTEWSVAIILVKDNEGNETLSVGTTVARSAAVPAQSLMKFLLEKNGDDGNLGSFSIYYSKDYALEYFARVPNKFLTSYQLIYYVGFVAAYCNTIEPEIAKFITQ